MPDQVEKRAVVGEDGELIQADTTVDPDAYSEFVATYVHRDPLWVRLQRHVQMYDGIYLFFSPWILLFALLILGSILSTLGQEFVGFIFYGTFVVMFFAAVIYTAFKGRNHQQP